MIGGGLLYFVLAADVIPDYVFPVGYLDDAIAVNMVVKQLALMPPADTLRAVRRFGSEAPVAAGSSRQGVDLFHWMRYNK